MELKIECQKRPEGSKSNALRRQGWVPGVLYGHQGTESISVVVEEKTVERLLKNASINNTLVDLNITDLSWTGKTLLREVQMHPWKGYPYHLSFFSVNAQDSIDAEVRLNFIGTPVGVKVDGGMFDSVITSLSVKCKAGNIPEAIDVDISGLQVGDALHVRELKLPEGVVTASDLELVIAHVLSPSGGAGESEASSES